MDFSKKLSPWERSLIEKYPEMFDEEFKKFGFEIGQGWNNLVKLCCKQLWFYYTQWNKLYIDSIPVPKILQVKQKCGGLRFYYKCSSKIATRIVDIVSFAEQLSFTICESCGRPGKLRKTKTLCDYCARKIDHNIKVRSYKPIEKQLRIQLLRHSGMWRIVSNALGKKERAQEELNKIISALENK